jgi:hypothetical protein
VRLWDLWDPQLGNISRIPKPHDLRKTTLRQKSQEAGAQAWRPLSLSLLVFILGELPYYQSVKEPIFQYCVQSCWSPWRSTVSHVLRYSQRVTTKTSSMPWTSLWLFNDRSPPNWSLLQSSCSLFCNCRESLQHRIHHAPSLLLCHLLASEPLLSICQSATQSKD